ncbi:hypothetical protein GSY74_06165 [Sulfurovum sp. bin170]|uniref:hypothetical protein n=1 Tax=Sulfurovum sp. bin170 TaxID=2695268 RepID=UPI0013DF0D9A|nr:hypothetical protein [Sulfurovum sp. bin170]NEW60863.1 hypothetical protein [Sulfurovum sp. bin170]
MQLLKFLFGIILAQMATAFLVLLSTDELDTSELTKLAIPILFISLTIALWFSSMAEHYRKDAIGKAEGDFAKEREQLRVNAERAKRRVEKKAQKDIVKEATTTHAKANFKVGMAFAGVLGIGGLFVFAQMVTVGLLAISAGGGAIGGYYWRGRRLESGRLREIEIKDLKVIESKPSRFSKFKLLKS